MGEMIFYGIIILCLYLVVIKMFIDCIRWGDYFESVIVGLILVAPILAVIFN